MFNRERLKAQRESIEKNRYDKIPGYGGKDGFPFSFMKLAQLLPGNFRLRFLWPTGVKNPDGAILVATHKIERVEDGSVEDLTCLAAESMIYKPDKASTYLDDRILKQANEVNAYEQVAKPFQRVLSKLTPWRRWWFPVLLYAKEVDGGTYVDKKTKETKQGRTNYTPATEPDAKPLDRILEIDADAAFLNKIWNVWDQDENLLSADIGRDCILTKTGKTGYDIKAALDRSPVPRATQEWVMKNYPDLVEKMEKFYFKDHIEIVSAVQNSWWAKYFGRKGDPWMLPEQGGYGFNLHDNQEVKVLIGSDANTPTG
jgi:hypothetical protein